MLFDDALEFTYLLPFEEGRREPLLCGDEERCEGGPADYQRGQHTAKKAREIVRHFRKISNVEAAHAVASLLMIRTGSTRVPAGFGDGCTRTRSSSTRRLKVGIFS